MLYQLSYDPLLCPPTYRIRPSARSAPARSRLLKANEERVYVVDGAASNRKWQSGATVRKIVLAGRRIRTLVHGLAPWLFSL